VQQLVASPNDAAAPAVMAPPDDEFDDEDTRDFVHVDAAAAAAAAATAAGAAPAPPVAAAASASSSSASRLANEPYRMFAWGDNSLGQLASGAPTSQLFTEPFAVVGRAVACGESHTALVTEQGDVYTWGCNKDGQLGRPLTTKATAKGVDPHDRWPATIASTLPRSLRNVRVREVACGAKHTAIVFENGALMTCGDGALGQLGHGDRRARSTFKQVSALETRVVVDVACGTAHTVAVLSDGALVAFGNNSAGQLGAAVGAHCSLPTAIVALWGVAVVQVAAGDAHSLVLGASGDLYAFGLNDHGQLGVGRAPPHSATPLLVPAIASGAKRIAAGGNRSAAIVGKGALLQWGEGGKHGWGASADEADAFEPLQVMLPGDKARAVNVAVGATQTVCVVHQRIVKAADAAESDDSSDDGEAGAKDAYAHVVHQFSAAGARDAPFLLQRGAGADVSDAALSMPVPGGGTVLPDGQACFAVASGARHAVVLASVFKPQSSRGPGQYVLHLTRKRVEELASAANRVGGDMGSHTAPEVVALTSAVSRVFSSGIALNQSFLDSTGRLSMGDTRAAFLAMMSSAPQLCLRTLIAALPPVLDWLDSRPPNDGAVFPVQLRLFFILLESPALMQAQHLHMPLLVRLLTKIQQLPRPLFVAFCQRLARHEAEYFVMPIYTTNRLVSLALTSPVRNLAAFALGGWMAQTLYAINEAHHIVSHALFCNATCSQVNLEAEVMQWRLGAESVCRFPFLMSAAVKAEVLQIEARSSMQKQMQSAAMVSVFSGQQQSPYLILAVRRDFIVEDALANIVRHPPGDLKKPLKIIFADEEAIDAGGVTKEFFHLITQKLFDVKYGMFVTDEQTRMQWFDRNSQDQLGEYQLIGILLGLAIYNGVIINVPFPPVLFKKLRGEPGALADLDASFPTVARNLQQLLEYAGDDVEDVFGLDFRVTSQYFGALKHDDLKPNGGNTPVTSANRKEYVELYVDFLLNKSIARQFDAFKAGFDLVVSGPALGLFRADEIELLVCGNHDFQIGDLKKHTTYDGGYNADTRVVKWFWEVVATWNEAKQREMLTFVTGSDRVPIAGLSSMKFVIYRKGADSELLCSAATCFNTLYLPEYR
jgi:E3 ubiquitin-protein ligase HERC3